MKLKRCESPMKTSFSKNKQFSWEKYLKKNTRAVHLPRVPFNVRIKHRKFMFNKDKLNLEKAFPKKRLLLKTQSNRESQRKLKTALTRHLLSSKNICRTQQSIRQSEKKHFSLRRRGNKTGKENSSKGDFFSKLKFPKKSQKLKNYQTEFCKEKSKTFKDQFKVLKLLGNGSNSSVYLGRNRVSRQLFAIKIINKSKLERQSELMNLNVKQLI